MSSKREEERNEKIIRGLMKLPPNRRCINCNSLGPQYVCNSFWTFVCITCSGIHREFTHRVKSVSMSKFTSQEVESLQNGGNQRAKEIYLKGWDFERQRLPSGNNVEKIREFIKNVYVDKKYASGKGSEKPPRDTQSERGEPETRRASSYHSYSQSPPYDFQYEERWARKQNVMLTRKPGSDRGVYSPGRYSDHVSAERFTIEGSSSRVSDYSVSSAGDPFKSYPQSPNSLKDSGLNSPTFDITKESRVDDDQTTHTEIMPSSSLNQANFASFDDAFPQPDQHQIKAATVPSVPQSFPPVKTTTQEKNQVNSVSPPMPSLVDLFQGTSNTSFSSLSFFDENPKDMNFTATHSEPVPNNSISSLSSLSFFEPPQNYPAVNIGFPHSESAPNITVSSLSFFDQNSQNSSAINSNTTHSESVSDSVGWATFDLQQHASTSNHQEFVAATEHSGIQTSVSDFNSKWPDFLNSQHENLPYSPALAVTPNNKEWRPFNDIDSIEPMDFSKGTSVGHFPGLHATEESSIDQSATTFMGEIHSQFERSTSNPFDIPYEAEFDSRDTQFYDMSTLQATLPSTESFSGAISDSWFLQDAANPQGGISYMAPQPPNSQLPNVQTNGAVASIGGNPFA